MWPSTAALGAPSHCSPPEFAESKEEDALEISLLFEVGNEGGEGVIQFGHETIVRVELAGVGVESALAGIVNPRR